MKRTHQTAFSGIRHNVTHAINSVLNWISPTTLSPQPAPQLPNQANEVPESRTVANAMDPFINLFKPKQTTDIVLHEKEMIESMSNHGNFKILPFELIAHIFQFLTIDTSRHLREVSKPLLFVWEKVAKNTFTSLVPAVHHLETDQGFKVLNNKQQVEIKYLIENKAEILNENNNNPRLRNAFAKLDLLENNSSLVAYHAKEKCLTSLNETIIRIEIARTQQSNNPTALLLNECHLTRFPSDIISDASLSEFWKKITRLYVGYNKLTTLPETIGQCAALRHLFVNNNQLTALPDTIGHCAALKWLYVENNQLTTLPDTIGHCAELQGLYVQNNQLTTLPDTIRQCTALWLLEAYNNQLTLLPDTIGQCAALRSLYLTKNKLTALPKGLRDDIIFYDEYRRPINKAQCLALQKKALINNEEEAQKLTPTRPR